MRLIIADDFGEGPQLGVIFGGQLLAKRLQLVAVVLRGEMNMVLGMDAVG